MVNKHPDEEGSSFLQLTKVAALLGYMVYFAGHVVFSVLVVPLFIFLAPFKKWRYRFIRWVFDRYIFFLSRRLLCWLRVYRFEHITGLNEALAAGPAIYMVNHRSRMDGPIMLATIAQSTVVIKASYGRNLLYAAFVKYLDFISVEAGVLQSLADAMEQAKRVLASGRSIIVFPEGTRAASGRLLPMKDIGLRLARSGAVPIIPVVLHSDLPFMAKQPGSLFPHRTINFSIHFCKPRRLQPQDRLCDVQFVIEREMQKVLAVLDKGTVWEHR